MDRPNLLLLTIDSLRADHTGFGGYGRDTTPFLDSIADQATVFHRAYATGPRTSESFQSLLAGTHPLEFGESPKLTDRHTTLAEVLIDRGYSTAGIHSNPYLSTSYGYDRGFDFFTASDDSVSATAKLAQRFRQYIDSESRIYGMLRNLYRWFEHRNRSVPYARAATITNQATEWLSDLDEAQRPFLLWTHYMDPHYPYVPPTEHRSAFRETRPRSSQVSDLFSRMLSDPQSVTESEVALLKDLYDGEIRYVDAQLRRLWDILERENLLEDTLVVITADHGEEFGEHGDFSHASTPKARRRVKLHDELLHVPLLVVDPTRTIDAENDSDVASLCDLPPSIVSIADADIPETWRGSPFWSQTETRAYSGHWIRLEETAYPAATVRDEEARVVYDGRNGRFEVLTGSERPELQSALESFLSDTSGSAVLEPDDDVSDATRERLRELGYLD